MVHETLFEISTVFFLYDHCPRNGFSKYNLCLRWKPFSPIVDMNKNGGKDIKNAKKGRSTVDEEEKHVVG